MSLFACFGGRSKTRRAFDYWDCSNLGLTDLPKEVLHHRRTLKQLTLTSNNIRDVPKAIFMFEQLTELDLSENVILFLPPSIQSLRSLTSLNVSKNSLSTIPDSIRECHGLIHLDVSANSLGTLPEGLTELRQLRTLCLNDCQLEELPPNIGKLSKLEVLELRENVINTLPQSVCHMVLLERLDLGVNEIESLTGVIGSLESLAELWLDSNLLSSLPDEIGSLRNLKFLEVSENQLMFLPLSISSLVSLQDFHISDNLLTLLPDTIGELRNLKMLKVERNRLTALPQTIDGWTEMVELSLSQNFLEEVPTSISALCHLENLNLDENSLFSVPSELGTLSQLNILSLRANNLTELPSEIGGLTNLSVLNVVGNRLQFLPYSLTVLDKLTAVWIAENQNRPLLEMQMTCSGDGQKMVTCILLPQQPSADSPFSSESASPHTDRKPHPTTVNFDPKVQDHKSNLTRDPTPYPKELHIKALQWRSAREAAAGTTPDKTSATSDVPLRSGRTRSLHRPYSLIRALSDPIEPTDLSMSGNNSRPSSRRRDHSREHKDYSRSPCTTPGPMTPVIREHPDRRRERPSSSPSPPPLALPSYYSPGHGHRPNREEDYLIQNQANGETRGKAVAQHYSLPPSSPTLASPGDDLNMALIANNSNSNNNNNNGQYNVAFAMTRRAVAKSSTYPLVQTSHTASSPLTPTFPPPFSSAYNKTYQLQANPQGQSEASTLSRSDAHDPRSSSSMESGFDADVELDPNSKWYMTDTSRNTTGHRPDSRRQQNVPRRPYVNVPVPANTAQKTRTSGYDHLIHSTGASRNISHKHSHSSSPLTNRGPSLVNSQLIIHHQKGSRSFDATEVHGHTGPSGHGSQSPNTLQTSFELPTLQKPQLLQANETTANDQVHCSTRHHQQQKNVLEELAQSSRRPHSPLPTAPVISPSAIANAKYHHQRGTTAVAMVTGIRSESGGSLPVHQRYPSDSYYTSDDSQGHVGAESSGQATPKNTPKTSYGAWGTSQDSGCDSIPNAGTTIKVELIKNPSLGLGIREGAVEQDKPVKQGYHVYKIVPGSPAEQCGKIKLGDRLIEINGFEVTSLDLPDILALLNVEKDATINLTLYREPSMTLL